MWGEKCYTDGTMTFRERALSVVKRIKKGRVMTYGGVAIAAGSPGGARAVGSLMKANLDPAVPCHRVIRADRKVGEYNRPGGGRTKAGRLAEEGVRIVRGRVDEGCIQLR